MTNAEAMPKRTKSRVWEAIVMVQGVEWGPNEPEIEEKDSSSGR